MYLHVLVCLSASHSAPVYHPLFLFLSTCIFVCPDLSLYVRGNFGVLDCLRFILLALLICHCLSSRLLQHLFLMFFLSSSFVHTLYSHSTSQSLFFLSTSVWLYLPLSFCSFPLPSSAFTSLHSVNSRWSGTVICAFEYIVARYLSHFHINNGKSLRRTCRCHLDIINALIFKPRTFDFLQLSFNFSSNSYFGHIHKRLLQTFN